jgi:hypothetical protein
MGIDMANKATGPADAGVISKAKEHNVIAVKDDKGSWWFKQKGNDTALNEHGIASNLEAWQWIENKYGVPNIRKYKKKKGK